MIRFKSLFRTFALFSATLLVGAFFVGCGMPETSQKLGTKKQKIYNGDLVPDTYLQVVKIRGGSCTGILLDHRRVITAAHCVCKDGDCNYYSNIRIGLNDGTEIQAGFVAHPSYSYSTKNYDVAMLQLVSDAPIDVAYEYPLLASQAPEVGDAITIVGFGYSDCNSSNEYISLGDRRIGTNDISGFRSSNLRFKSSATNGEVTMPGDSGGPSFVTRNGNRELAGLTRGLVGNTNLCTDSSAEVDYTNLYLMLDWIKGSIKNNIALEASNNKYVTTSGTNLVANQDGPYGSTKLSIMDLNGGELQAGDEIYLMSNNGKFWTVDTNLTASNTQTGADQKFTIYKVVSGSPVSDGSTLSDQDTIALKSDSGKWVTLSGSTLVATSSTYSSNAALTYHRYDHIYNPTSMRCYQALSSASGSKIKRANCSDSSLQKFVWYNNYMLQLKGTNLCIRAELPTNTSGKNLKLANCNTSANDQTFIRVGSQLRPKANSSYCLQRKPNSGYIESRKCLSAANNKNWITPHRP